MPVREVIEHPPDTRRLQGRHSLQKRIFAQTLVSLPKNHTLAH